MATKYVVTVHGINTKGEWQTRVEEVFRHHFKAIHVKYPQYRCLGALRLLVDIYLFGAGCAVLLLGLFGVVNSARAYLVGLALVLLAIPGAMLRRHLQVRKFKRTLDAKIPLGAKVHVIAHSFGTYLLGASLKTFPDLQFDRLVLVGCVLPRAFPWHKILLLNPTAFRDVRNEVGRKDPVVWLLYWIKQLPGVLPGMGSAGVKGFSNRSGLVHQLSQPYGPCQACDLIMPSSIIHNVTIPEFTHSDAFIGSGHARTFWLPHLWGIDPADYRQFLGIAALAADLEKLKDHLALRQIESEFRQKPWRWAEGLSLEEWIQAQLSFAEPGSQEDIDTIVRQVWRVVDMALAEMELPSDTQRGDIVRALHPRIAVLRAISARPVDVL